MTTNGTHFQNVLMDLPDESQYDEPKYTVHRRLLRQYRQRYRDHALLVKDFTENSTTKFSVNSEKYSGALRSFNTMAEENINHVFLRKIDPLFNSTNQTYFHSLRHVDVITAFYLPQEMRECTLTSNDMVIAEFYFDDSIAVDPPLAEILNESNTLPSKANESLEYLLTSTHQNKTGVIFNRQPIIEQGDTTYVRRILIQPWLPLLQTVFSIIRLVSKYSCPIMIEVMCLTESNRRKMLDDRREIVCWGASTASSSRTPIFSLAPISSGAIYNKLSQEHREDELSSIHDLLPQPYLPDVPCLDGGGLHLDHRDKRTQ
jgi:hypothetical protein